jgi:SAM-dependent methyltransferase
MHTHTHRPGSPAPTEGRLIRWASFYDVLANIMTFGQASRLRRMTVEQAQLKPGEKVLDVGCGTGGVTIPAKLQVGKNGEVTGIDPSPEMIRPSNSSLKRFFTLLVHHGHGLQFGIEDLPKLMREAGFEDVEQLDARFLTIGFVRAKKPATAN